MVENGGMLPVESGYNMENTRLGIEDALDCIECGDTEQEIDTCCEIKQLPQFCIFDPSGCHAPGQEVLMADGTTEVVEDVRVGDELIGPDSESRTVLSLTSGTGEMYRVSPTKGDSFVVNSEHRLSLIRTNDGTSLAGDIVDPTVEEWLEWSDTHKHIHKLFRRPVEFDNDRHLHLDPYVMGILIGDGSLKEGAVFFSESSAVIDAVRGQLDMCHLTIADHPSSGNAKKCYISTPGGGPSSDPSADANPILDSIRNVGLDVTAGEKFIPHDWKVAGERSRKALLGGLMDADGWVNDGRAEYYTKSEELAEDVAFVARSLGFAAYARENETPEYGTHRRVAIHGDMSELATMHESKQGEPRRQEKSVLRAGFDVEPVCESKYYGFTVDGDNQYLLDDFTVTHNCGKTLLVENVAT